MRRAKTKAKVSLVGLVIDDFLILYDSYDVVNIACHETSWVINSGASVHARS